jgi:hypothetical protein
MEINFLKPFIRITSYAIWISETLEDYVIIIVGNKVSYRNWYFDLVAKVLTSSCEICLVTGVVDFTDWQFIVND